MQQLERPHVICHMMTTLDGKITSASQTDILSDDFFSTYTQIEDLLKAHNWLLGRVTMQMFASNEEVELSLDLDQEIEEDYLAPDIGDSCMFGVDTNGKLRWKSNEIQLSNVKKPVHLVVIVTNQTPKEYLQYLRRMGISYLHSGRVEIDFEILFTKMKKLFNVDRLLLEGGGKLNGSLMDQGLVDEISLLLTPTVINQSGAPSLFEKETTEIHLTHFILQAVEKLENDVVWLRYLRQ